MALINIKIITFRNLFHFGPETFITDSSGNEVDTSLLGARVGRVLEKLAVHHGLHKTIVVDNGITPELPGLENLILPTLTLPSILIVD